MKKQSYDRILIPHDSSHLADSVIPEILAIVSAFGSKVVLTQVIDSVFQINAKLAPSTGFTAGNLVADLTEQVQKNEAKVARHNLDRLQKKLHEFGITGVETHILEGNPGDEIVKLAKKIKSDLIIISTHGRSGLGRVLLGSVTDQVIHQAHCPVLVVRPKHRK